MICISELRGLQQLQAKHPELVVVALSVADDKSAIAAVLKRNKLEALRVAVGKDWQGKFGLAETIPATVVVESGRVRTVHQSVLFDPVAQLEADVAAIHAAAASSRSK